MIRDASIPNEDKFQWVKLHALGKNVKEWNIPKSDEASKFATEMILHTLLEASNNKVGCYVNLPERAIKWLVRSAQVAFKKEASFIELKAPINITGDFHG